MRSIRRELLVGLLLTVLAAFVVAGWAIYRQALKQANELFDFQLQQMALSLPDEPFSSVLGGHGNDGGLVIQIWSRNGVQLYYSHPRAPVPQRAELGFTTVQTPSGNWRLYGAVVGNNVVQLAQPMSVRDAVAATMALRTLVPLVILLPVLGILVWIIVGRGLRPLKRVTRDLDQRAPGALDAVDETPLPAEVRPLVRALNNLLERLSHALDQQKAFVADAAHELRTPLAALQLQVQLLERASDEGDRRAALHDLRHGVQRASHMVQQLLTLARQDPASARTAHASLDLMPLLRGVVADHAPLAQARGIDLGMDSAVDTPTIVNGDADALRTLFGNLVDNALKYTPPGGRVDVSVPTLGGTSVEPAGGVVRVRIEDNGPGIAAEERPRVFDRFYRHPGHSSEGSGLGLAIVQRIADAHGARVELADGANGHGLRVDVIFGHAMPPL